jgi:hypothetical protein
MRGTGSVTAPVPPTYRKSGSAQASAAARQDRVGAERRLHLGAVELDHEAVDLGLLARVHPEDLGRDRLVHVLHGLEDALAPVALLISVAQLERLARAGRGAGGDARAGRRSALEKTLDLDRGVAAGIEDLAGVNAFDCVHVGS